MADRADVLAGGADGAPALGAWIKLATTESVEIMAAIGMDFVVVDLEHAPLDLETAARMIVLARACGMTPLVRVPGHEAATIGRVLDSGAGGILVPHVEDADQARAVVSAVRFPPHGARGAGGTSRAGRWGLLPRAEYTRFGNEQVLCIPQLESAGAIGSAPEILAVDGVDAVFLGAGDLALSLGLGAGDPEVRELLGTGRAAAAAAGKPCGAASAGVEGALGAAGLGHRFVVIGNDVTLLARAADSLVAGVRNGLRGAR
ncbi:aldolase/citrate lyase family protein [Pseudonocardia sp. NPDC046786]|uniref:HpcH/HpaI aldolase family protein n=1 Tax=Pseudonocardia sp. NPDC046786 TaxID=3155471 RepID=UPI0033E3678C